MAQRGGALRDLLGALGIVAAILGAMFLYTGTWPPMVVVESASMMHPQADPGYGNLGTIDPGDLVLVKQVESLEDIELAVDGGESHYGGPGDVIVYHPDGRLNATPIIHRAITYVEVFGGGEQRSYRVYVGNGTLRSFGSEGIYLPTLGIAEPRFTPEDGWKPTHSGLITKGDNPETNALPDQVTPTPLSSPVKVAWVEGVSRGEIPWVGLLKLSLSPTLNVNPPPDGWARIGNAYAPPDLWVMLFLSVTALVILPLTWDVLRAWREAEEDGVVPPLSEFLRVHLLRQPPGEPVDDDAFEVVGGDEPPPSSPAGGSAAAARPRARFQPVSRPASEASSRPAASSRAAPGPSADAEADPGPSRGAGASKPSASFQVVSRSGDSSADEDEDEDEGDGSDEESP